MMNWKIVAGLLAFYFGVKLLAENKPVGGLGH